MVALLFVSLLVVALGIAAVYFAVFFSAVPEVARERLGELPELPPELGLWLPDRESAAGRAAEGEGLLRETRLFLDEGSGLGSGRLLEQARYRSLTTNAIVRVEPDRVVKRRRQPR